MDKGYDRVPTERSRELRSNSTSAERVLWKHLRNRQLSGARFNRQVPIGPFICDFVARSAKLVIELDGGQHADQATADAKRTSYLQSRGYRVLRFWNNEVLGSIQGVIEVIEEALKDRPSPCPLPQAGGEDARNAEGKGS